MPNTNAVETNAAVYAMKKLQQDMTGEAEKAGLRSDEDVIDMTMEMRAEEQKYKFRLHLS